MHVILMQRVRDSVRAFRAVRNTRVFLMETRVAADGTCPSSSHYISAELFLTETDDSLRMFINYRTVNCITKQDWYPLRHIKQLVQQLGASSYFWKNDLASGYHKIRIWVADQQKMTFSTQSSLYRWMVLRVGLANISSRLKWEMNCLLTLYALLRTLVSVYHHNVLNNSLAKREHLDHEWAVLYLIQNSGWKHNQSECEWFR